MISEEQEKKDEDEKKLDEYARDIIDTIIITPGDPRHNIVEVLTKVYESGFKAGRQYGDIDFLERK